MKRHLPLLCVFLLSSCVSSEDATQALVIDLPQSKHELFTGIIQKFETDTSKVVLLIDSQTDPDARPADLLFTDSTSLASLIAQSRISPIDKGLASGLLDGAVETFSRGNELYGIPFSFETVALVCHRDLVSSQPASWEELVDKGYKPSFTPGNAFETLFYLSGFQDSVSAENGLVIEKADAQQLNTWLASQRAVFSVTDYSEVVGKFSQKNSSCLIAGPWMVAALSEFDLIAIELPQVGPSAPLAPALSLGLALSTDSMNKELAERFLRLLASEDAQREIYELSGVLPATSAFTSEISNPLLRALLESNAEVFPVPDLSGSFAELAALEELITDSLARNENFETIYARYLEKLGEK